MPKISVIVPVYNAEKYLKKCLDSLVSQSFQDLEIILVNDGSTDNSQKIIEKYEKKYKNIHSLFKENGGQSSARNLGLSKATGEYISFIDSDDYIDKELYSSCLSLMNQNYDIILFHYYITFSDKKVPHEVVHAANYLNITEKEFLFAEVAPWNKIYKRSFLIEHQFRFPEGIIYEDYASTPTLVKHHPKIGCVNQYLYYYIQSDTSTMRNMEYKEKYENLFPATEYLYQSLHGEGYEEELEYLIVKHMLFHGALNFYKYQKLKQIDRISDYIKDKFPKWLYNKYIKKENLRTKVLCYLFYHKQYKWISFVQKVKKIGSF